MELKVVLEKQEEGGYTAYVPSLPGCISEGDTKEEALGNIKEAIELYRRRGHPPPDNQGRRAHP
ncbi:MAG: type II toxin-antitoxin system HicB family antitoxin [Thermodesulfobacteriota bacterium]